MLSCTVVVQKYQNIYRCVDSLEVHLLSHRPDNVATEGKHWSSTNNDQEYKHVPKKIIFCAKICLLRGKSVHVCSHIGPDNAVTQRGNKN